MTGVLLLHGFGGGTHETANLYKMLCEKGFFVAAPEIAGHGKNKHLFSKTSRSDWVESVKPVYDALFEKYDEVIIIGFSMGGLIAVNLYHYRPCHKIVFINTPVYYWNMPQIIQNLHSDFPQYSKFYYANSKDKPLYALLQFISLLTETKKQFAGVTCDVLIFQTLDDDTVKPKSANYIHQNIPGKKKLVWLKKGGHSVLESPCCENVFNDIIEFIDV